MKKLFLLLALMVPAVSMADGDHHRDNHRSREYHEVHKGKRFGWGEFVGGIVLGGIIAHEIDGHYYDKDRREVRRVTICKEYVLYDRWNNVAYDEYGRVIVQRRCHEEWVYID